MANIKGVTGTIPEKNHVAPRKLLGLKKCRLAFIFLVPISFYESYIYAV